MRTTGIALVLAFVCASFGCAAQTSAPPAPGLGVGPSDRHNTKPGNICTEGDVRGCQRVYAFHDGSVDCELSTQVCILGKWSACGESTIDETTTSATIPASCEEAKISFAPIWLAVSPTNPAFVATYARLSHELRARFAAELSVHMGIAKVRLGIATVEGTFDETRVLMSAPVVGFDAKGTFVIEERATSFSMLLGDTEIEATGVAIEGTIDDACGALTALRLTVFIPESAGRTIVSGQTLAGLLGPLGAPLGKERGWRVVLAGSKP